MINFYYRCNLSGYDYFSISDWLKEQTIIYCYEWGRFYFITEEDASLFTLRFGDVVDTIDKCERGWAIGWRNSNR